MSYTHTVRLRLSTQSTIALAVGVTAVLAIGYFGWTPLSPDLAAQVARADVVRRAGNVSWWTGWFGGLSLPTYSLFVPAWMAAFGVRLTGGLAALAGAVATAVLVRDAPRPRAGAVAFAVAGMADLVVGRITFVVGFTFAAWALVALRGRHAYLGAALAVLAYFTSALAGLFLGLALVAVLVADRQRRRDAALLAGLLLGIGVSMAVLFPGTGVMPFTLSSTIPPALCCAAVAVFCPNRVVRVTALLVLLTIPAFLLVPGAVGGNIARLAWVCATPIVAAYAPLGRRYLAAVLALLAVWPLTNLASAIHSGRQPSASSSYYQPLAAQLRSAAAAAGPAARGERVEVVDTANHWASVYLAPSVALARGWDRQVDNADNPLFYVPSALTAASYEQWLHSLAVGWVALPNATLDYASVQEGALVRHGLDYLTLIWSTPQWRLYRVTDATPLATGASVVAVAPSSITLRTSAPTSVSLRVRWSSYLTVIAPGTRRPLPACLSDASGWTQLYVPRAETFVLTSKFRPAARFAPPHVDCVADLTAAVRHSAP